MIQSASHFTHINVKAGDWIHDSLCLPYYGKYQVGRFMLSNEFMVQYMKVIHNISINSNETQSYCTTSADTIMYMEHYGIIDCNILLKMRQMVKKPEQGYVVYSDKNVITGIEKDSNNG